MNSSPCLDLYAIGVTVSHGIWVWLHMQVFPILQPYTCWVCFCHHYNLSPHAIHIRQAIVQLNNHQTHAKHHHCEEQLLQLMGKKRS